MIFNENGEILLNENIIIKSENLDKIIWNTSDNDYSYKNEKDLPDFIRMNLNKIYQDCAKIYGNIDRKDFMKTCKFFSARFIKWDKPKVLFTVDLCFTNYKYDSEDHLLSAELDFDQNRKLINPINYGCDG